MSNYTAWMDDVHLITISVDELDPLRKRLDTPPIIYWEKEQTYFHTEFHQAPNPHTLHFSHQEALPIGEELTLLWGEAEIPVFPRDIVRKEAFDERYSAPDTTLGPICTEAEATFQLWTPVATTVEVNVDGKLYPMNRTENFVWTLTLAGDWHGSPYHFEASIHGKRVRVNDPYAKGMTPDSETSVLIDLSRTMQLKNTKLPVQYPTDAIIYELHVRDATIHPNSGVKNKGRFLGLTEKYTTTENGYSTGLSYLNELGVTHVQLLPVNDYARVPEMEPELGYNWGYDPLYFQVPEGSYSVLPDQTLARINELKKMIQAFHEETIGVILDVVFNHVFVREESDFEKLVPGYYFRYDNEGNPSNGTGVGNDFASERKMARKFIVDTIDYWLTEYKVDGFRFDLMGNIDIETIRQIKERCLQEERMILLLGEGWDLPTALDREKKAITAHAAQLKGIGFFNDYFRDTLKGRLFDTGDKGFINGSGRFHERLGDLVKAVTLTEGISNHEIQQSVNYVECHDNHTLWDRLALTNKEDFSTRKKMHQLGTALTLLSQGIPFLHAGQEFFRTKYGVENSYLSGDAINAMNWTRRETENETVEFVKKLIQLRKNHSVFRMRSQEEIAQRLHLLEGHNPLFGFTLLEDGKDITIFINPTREVRHIQLPAPGNWKVTVTNHQERPDKVVQGDLFHVYEYEVAVLEKDRF
ncbi:type I pullulanase [Oceanobacillus sp. HCA-5259]|uniref:type I pullulanase n=1 Tax=Oceanobacillus sp. HCA-5259 TaxID=3134661 RepID=UPI0030C4DF2C